MNYLLKNSLDFSTTNLFLPIRLGVVWRGDAVVYFVLLQQCREVRVVEVWAAVTDDGSRITVSGEDASCDEYQNLLMVVCPSGDCLDPLGHIVHRHQYVLFPVRRWERSHEIYPPKIENFYLQDRPHQHLISLGDVDHRLTLYAFRVETVGVLEDGGSVEAALQDLVRGLSCREGSSARRWVTHRQNVSLLLLRYASSDDLVVS